MAEQKIIPTHRVDSSNIDEIGWEEGTLRVVFKNGATYDYTTVPESVYLDMCDSQSPGRFLNQQIKPLYKCEKIVKDED